MKKLISLSLSCNLLLRSKDNFDFTSRYDYIKLRTGLGESGTGVR